VAHGSVEHARTLTFDQLSLGDTFLSTGRTITEADIVAFAGLSGDYNPLHTDAQWVAENTPFQGRIAHGLLVLAISSGLRTPGLDQLEILAFLDVRRAMKAPTYPGDTLRVHNTVAALRPSSSQQGSGVVTMSIEVTNQRGEVVQVGEDIYLVRGVA
jgi:3-hydroxybutyryl-CoA dehydratase